MSSISARKVVASHTFRRSASFFSVAMLVLGIATTVYSARLMMDADQVEQQQIEERLEELAEHIREDGLAVVIEEHSEEFGALWPAEEAGYLFEAEEVLVLVLHRAKPVLGFVELQIEPGWHRLTYRAPGEFLEPLAVDLRALRVDLADQVSLVGALPRTSVWHHAVAVTTAMSVLFVGCLILGLVASYLASRNVLVRLSALSNVVEGMAAADLEARAAVSAANDEFDQVASDINKMLEQIGRLMRNLEEISVGAAHDLKTPLTRLDQRLQSILLTVAQPGEVQSHVEAARQHVQTLLTTFNALLRLGEIESGRLRTQFAQHSLSELVQDVAETYEVVFAEQGRPLEISVVPNIQVVGDRDLIAQQVSNLLENILEHTEAPVGGWVRLQAHPQGALLQIGDDGPGIPLAEQDRVFDRFYRVDKSRTKPGNGLGLSLVASISSIHNAPIVMHQKQPGRVIDITYPNPIL